MNDAHKIIYQIDSCCDREDREKEIPADIKFGRYFLHFVLTGRSAILVNINNNKTLTTSAVEQVFIWENGIKLTTKNTIYYLKPYICEEGI